MSGLPPPSEIDSDEDIDFVFTGRLNKDLKNFHLNETEILSVLFTDSPGMPYQPRTNIYRDRIHQTNCPQNSKNKRNRTGCTCTFRNYDPDIECDCGDDDFWVDNLEIANSQPIERVSPDGTMLPFTIEETDVRFNARHDFENFSYNVERPMVFTRVGSINDGDHRGVDHMNRPIPVYSSIILHPKDGKIHLYDIVTAIFYLKTHHFDTWYELLGNITFVDTINEQDHYEVTFEYGS